MLSEILAPLFGCHQQLLLDDLRGRRPFGHEDKLEVSDNLVDNFVIFDKGDLLSSTSISSLSNIFDLILSPRSPGRVKVLTKLRR